jgi:hypothetical protein
VLDLSADWVQPEMLARMLSALRLRQVRLSHMAFSSEDEESIVRVVIFAEAGAALEAPIRALLEAAAFNSFPPGDVRVAMLRYIIVI